MNKCLFILFNIINDIVLFIINICSKWNIFIIILCDVYNGWLFLYGFKISKDDWILMWYSYCIGIF